MVPDANTTPGAGMRTSEERYRRLFESAQDGILVLDAETGLVIDANPYLENLLGFAHDELVGRPVWELGPLRDVAANLEAFKRLQSSEYSRYENLPLETRGKEFLEVEFISNVYLADGKRVIQCNIRDITERRRAAGKLQAANGELADLVTELRRRGAEMQLLNRMGSLLQACTTQDEACRVIATSAAELFAGQDGGLAMLRPGGTDLVVVADWGDARPVAASFALDTCWGIRHGRPHEVAEPGVGLPCRHFRQQPEQGYLCIPLFVQGEFLGLLCLIGGGTGSGEPRLGRRDLALNFGQTIKLSLHNLRLQERLREQAIRDPLTGLYNRRFLEDNLDRELHRSKRQATPLGIVMLDLDHFKHFNDAFGHEAGDLILTRVGKVLQTVLRKSDIACRYGGEEFVLVFPESSLDDTRRRVEEIRSLVRDMEIWHGQRRLGTVTMSAGLAMAPGNGSTAHALIAAADDAMYVAKHDGRDRLVCCAPAAAGTSTALIVLEEPHAATDRAAPRILKITDPPRGAKRPSAGGPGRGQSEEA